MKPFALMAVLAASLALAGGAAAQPAPIPANIAAAVADPHRPAEDVARDAERHPAETLAFAGVPRGAVVVDLLPGGGYFTRLFSKAVGPGGHVYAIVPQEILARFPKAGDSMKAIAADPAYANVTVLVEPIDELTTPRRVNLVWTAQNYHDLHDPFLGPANMTKVNQAIWRALRPEGTYLILDHAGELGSGVRDTNTLHRIDPAVVKAEVTSAGFVFEGSSDILRNPDDDHTLKVFDPAIRGHTDQFVFKFQKPR